METMLWKRENTDSAEDILKAESVPVENHGKMQLLKVEPLKDF